ncbi:MAG: 2-succinyl-5-enolpyruvyl-6-hydroxy-3-cyclohexene-1-carboxylic-acid synthase [Muribaculaceae bacterium]
MRSKIIDTTTDHEACNALVEVLFAKGVRNAVISPGSRNAPLIVAFARCESIKKYVVVDERSAAFIALGLAQQLHEPVAIVCTSGTALLNYAPAVAEAYYQQIPLIVISADRPIEWIDQADSQTLRQYNALSNFVKRSYDIPARYCDDTLRWYINRTINDAMITALNGRKSPVHINVQLIEPLCGEMNKNEALPQRIIDYVNGNNQLTIDCLDALKCEILKAKKVLIVAGMCDKNERLNNAINYLSTLPNVVVLTESISNLHGSKLITTIDRTLMAISKNDRSNYAPDLLITFGGALVTRMLKQFLRTNSAKRQWHVGVSENTIDTLQSLTTRIDIKPHDFFQQIAEKIAINEVITSNYSSIWHKIDEEATITHDKYVEVAEWCDLKAFSIILPHIPNDYNLQLSNGTTIRYAQLFKSDNIRQSNCNRGVAGIDGATSTALGASLAFDGVTLLITGDMSMSYDLSGLASQYNNPRFKLIVICNGGGGIFRFLKGPSTLPELEDYFEVSRDIPVKKYADAFGFDYYEANDETTLNAELKSFLSNRNRASILAVFTPAAINAEILRGYFHRNK